MPKFTRTPAQQRRELRARRRIADMPAAERTMLDTLATEIGGEEMTKKIKSLQLGTAKEAREKSLEFGERGLGLKTRRFEFAKKQILPTTLLGVAEVGLGVYAGMERRKTAQEEARWRLSQRKRYEAQTALEYPYP